MAPTLDDLPVEILNCTISHFNIARDLYHLSQTCKRLHAYAITDGFRVFVKDRFPSIQSVPAWKDAARHLTSVSRAWDRKAFVARRLEDPSGRGIYRWRGGRRSATQTVGYRPAIDSYCEQPGNNWDDRREVLIYGAGAKLFVRAKRSLNEAANPYYMKQVIVSKNGNTACKTLPTRYDDGSPVSDPARLLGREYHVDRLEESFDGSPGDCWLSYHEDENIDGVGDITSVNVLRPHQRISGTTETCIVGRANGQLKRLEIDLDQGKCVTRNQYDTFAQGLRSTDISNAPEPLLVAGLSQSDIALYPLQSEISSISPIDKFSVASSKLSSVIHSTKFLSSTKVAAGIGSSQSPIRIYSVLPSGLDKEPLRAYSTESPNPDSKIPEEAPSSQDARKTVFCIAPLGGTSRPGGGEGDLFLSGWFDGTTRLHDLRSPAPWVSYFENSLDYSAVCSVLPIGRERLVVGSADKPCVEAYDFRMSGGRKYFSAAADPCAESAANPWSFTQQDESCCNYHHESRFYRAGYSMFLVNEGFPLSAQFRSSTGRSGVYSLSSPSPDSPVFYAGLEDRIIEVGVTENVLQFADSPSEPQIRGRPEESILRGSPSVFRRRRGPLNLVLFEHPHASDPRAGNLRYSQGLPRFPNELRNARPGWDSRWFSSPGPRT